MKTSKDKILVILSRFPYPLEKGDKLRAFHQLKELSKHFDVTLFSISDKDVSQSDKKVVKNLVSELYIGKTTWLSRLLNMVYAFLTKKPFQVGYFYSYRHHNKVKALIKKNNFKHIYNQLVRTSEYTKNIHDIPKTLDYMDALSSGIKRRIDDQPFYKKWLFKIEAKRLTKYEQYIFDYYENRTMISAQDAELILHPDRNKIIPIANGIDDTFFEELNRKEKYDLVFVGNLSYPPNIKAVEFLIKDILPLTQNTSLLISGATPTKLIKKLAQENSQVTLTGWVDDIRESYCNAKIFVAPMFIGTGMQNKILESMALGTPCITTTLANNAIEGKHKENILVANNAEEFARNISLLLDNPALREQISGKAKIFVQERYNWESTTKNLINLMR